jgi:D-alanine-D-alanine ligase-like ATP-grasp enzyme
MVLEHMGIPTAPFTILPAVRLGGGDHLQSVIAEALAKSRHQDLMKFPLFIKPASEGSSKGIYSFSKVRDMAQLEDGVRELHSRYPDQDILIETFLGGSEYSVSIVGTGPSARVIGTIRLDWKTKKKESSGSVGAASTSGEDAEGDYDIPVWEGPEFEEPYPAQVLSAEGNPEVQRTEDLALRAWRALDGRDTCRMDLRWGLDGLPYVLEVCDWRRSRTCLVC